jgi:ubiquinone/menaquinone biosynthesis C-methylase UbiE
MQVVLRTSGDESPPSATGTVDERQHLARLLRRNLADLPPHRALVRSVESLLMSRVVLRAPVLDVGCGDGHFAATAYPHRLEVGVDVRAGRSAKDRVSRACLPAAYHALLTADAIALPFADGAFRTVLSNSVLEHVPEIDRALSEIGRVAARGGVFAFTAPSEHFGDFLLGSALLRRAGLRPLAGRYAAWFDRISAHFHRLAPQAWERKLAAVGFEVQHWQYYVSAAAHRAFDLAHYLGVPHLMCHRMTGRWVPPWGVPQRLTRWLTAHADPSAQQAGAYLFFLCRKRRT